MRSPLRILYVEDNPVVREVTSELLINDQRQIVALGTAEEALQEFAERAFDVVITDISLPAMDGWELTRRLKASDDTRHIPIIVLTAHALVTDRAKAFEAGCDDYDTKPIEFTRLSEKIENFLLAKKLS